MVILPRYHGNITVDLDMEILHETKYYHETELNITYLIRLDFN